MMYPYLTLNDDTEITHSRSTSGWPCESLHRKHRMKKTVFTMPPAISLITPGKAFMGYSDKEMEYFKRLICDNANQILESV